MTREIVELGHVIVITPTTLPDGRWVARAVVTRQVDGSAHELAPSYEPFTTEVEAATAAHTAALAWIHKSCA